MIARLWRVIRQAQLAQAEHTLAWMAQSSAETLAGRREHIARLRSTLGLGTTAQGVADACAAKSKRGLMA